MELSKNQKVVERELSRNYEMGDLKKLAKSLGVPASELVREGATRASVSYVASVIAKRDAFLVRDKLEQMGFDVADIVLDEYETSQSRGQEAASESEFEAEAESEGEDADGDEPEADGEEEQEADGFNPDDLSQYFGKGQVEILQSMHKHHEAAQQAHGPSQTFSVTYPDGGFAEIEGTPPRDFQRVLDLAVARKPILLIGPTGCGKTHLAGTVAESLKLPHYSISCTEGMSENQLTGWLLPVGDSGRFVYVQATFVKAYEEGGVYLLDEVDASDPNVLLVINTAVANSHMHIPQRHENPVAVKHRDFVLIAAANTFGRGADMQFVGRNQLDEATLDRFKVGTVLMDYDPDVETALVHADVLAWGRKMRDKIKGGQLKKSLSTRFMRDLSDMYSMSTKKYGQAFWEQQLTAGWSKDEVSRIR